jgi:hypothetical protein
MWVPKSRWVELHTVNSAMGERQKTRCTSAGIELPEDISKQETYFGFRIGQNTQFSGNDPAQRLPYSVATLVTKAASTSETLQPTRTPFRQPNPP